MAYAGMEDVTDKAIEKYAKKYKMSLYDEDENRKESEEILEELAMRLEDKASIV